MSERSCRLSETWLLAPQLADRIDVLMDDWQRETRIAIGVLSGHRTRSEQEKLERDGRPTAPFDLSTHTTCPATGADMVIFGFVTTAMKATFGRIAVMNGLRWGGGGPADPETGIPVDWNHIDLGPRG